MIYYNFLILSIRTDWFIVSKLSMACIKQKSIFDLPDEVIEKIFSFLSFNDLFKLSKEGKRLEGCVKRVSKRKPFSKSIH